MSRKRKGRDRVNVTRKKNGKLKTCRIIEDGLSRCRAALDNTLHHIKIVCAILRNIDQVRDALAEALDLLKELISSICQF